VGQRTLKEVAAELHNYVSFRAHREGRGYGLDPKFFLGHLRDGITRFFGITIGPNGIEDDEQNPSALEAWRGRLN
jgi:hypothetical protein